MPPIKPILSITIPTYNEELDLKNCLSSISRQNCSKDLFEIIIVDNFSEDNTLKVVEEFSEKINISILKNKIKDAEVSKMIGFKKSKGELFMYMDADMKLADSEFIKKMLLPFKEDKRIVGNFVKFVVSKKQPLLTRVLSYDEFQRDPIFKFFTIGIKDILVKNKGHYWLCKCSQKNIPPQGLMIYRKELIEKYARNKIQLIDNEIPAVLVEEGNYYFAYVSDTGIEHLILRSLKELWNKRVRNLQRTYFPNEGTRKYKWVDWEKDWPKVFLWLLYTNSFFLPILTSIIKMFKYEDSCFLSEPILNLISTYSIIYGVLKNKL